jgi:aldehyde:ferredoxin oxidoreductase
MEGMKILRIDMGAAGGPKAKAEDMGKYSGLGGRWLTSSIVDKEVDAECSPLGPNNKLVLAAGLLSGTAAVMSGRISAGAKSPLTGGIKESNSGGQAGQVMARLGYAAIVLEGQPEKGMLYKIFINKDGVKIMPDASLKGLGNYAICERMQNEFGEKVACISIGPAGDRLSCNSSVAISDMEGRPTRHCGRGGMGAVMGSKGVKVIALDEAGCKNREAKNPDKFKEACKAWAQGIRDDGVSQGLGALGTNMVTNPINEAGAYPTRNFSEGRFAGADKICGETQAQIEVDRGGLATHGCHRGCIIQCSGIFNDKAGNFVTKQPEYETVWSLGGNCLIDNLDSIARMDRMCDDFGVDTIEMGGTMGVAMEGGLAEFGDWQAAERLLREVGKGSPLGKLLASGTTNCGKVLGVERLPCCKGQSMPAYDPRGILGMGVTYGTSTMGADHTAGYAVATNIFKIGGDVDPLGTEGQVETSRDLQIGTMAIDGTGMCLFVAFPMMASEAVFQSLLDLINSFMGWNWTAAEYMDMGKKMLKMERDFNKRAGFTPQDDRIPEFMRREPLPPHNVTYVVTDEDMDRVFNW